MSNDASLSRAELVRVLDVSESATGDSDELKRMLRESKRHQLELELQNRELREAQRALDDLAPMALMSLDVRAHIQEINLTGAALLRQERSELLGQPLTPFVEPSDLGRFLQHLRQCLAGETVRTELKLRAGGNPLLVQLHSAPLQGRQGGLCRTALIDLTELRQAQLRLSFSERMATVGTLAAGVAHEINHPLSFLLNTLELAERQLRQRDGTSTDMLLAALADARLGTERIRNIVRDLGTFSHPDENPLSRVDVQQVLDLSVKMALGEIRYRARLVRDYENVPEVLANGSRLGQVFLNLLVNAAHSIPEGHASQNEIRLRTRASEGYVIVEVRDTGSGIPQELQGRIFEPFFTTKDPGMGTGLGLSISRGLVKELGGDITVESHPGQGSVFRVRLPAAPDVQATLPLRPTPSHVSSRRGRLLIVDDEPLLAQTLQMLLSEQHDVTVARDAREAMKLLRGGNRYDAILCDLMMAEMTGKQFHEELSHLEPEQAQRIIFMTGGAFTPGTREFLARVPNPQLTKPFKVDVLEEQLSKFLT